MSKLERCPNCGEENKELIYNDQMGEYYCNECAEDYIDQLNDFLSFKNTK